jgi:hypothetical protein
MERKLAMRLRRGSRIRQAAETAQVKVDAKAEARIRDTQSFLDQAKWLMEYHTKRSDGAQQRAIGVIAFSGVLLALLPRGFDPNTHPGGWIIRMYVVCAVIILITVFIAISALIPRKTEAPGVSQLREMWHEHLRPAGERSRDRHNDITETLLLGTFLTDKSPVDHAKVEADTRTERLKYAYYTLALALIAVAALGTQLAFAAGGTTQ